MVKKLLFHANFKAKHLLCFREEIKSGMTLGWGKLFFILISIMQRLKKLQTNKNFGDDDTADKETTANK